MFQFRYIILNVLPISGQIGINVKIGLINKKYLYTYRTGTRDQLHNFSFKLISGRYYY